MFLLRNTVILQCYKLITQGPDQGICHKVVIMALFIYMRSGASLRDFVIFYSKALFLYPVSLSFVRWKMPYSSALVLDLVVLYLLISLVYCVTLKGQLPCN